MRNIRKIIVHCTATPKGRDVSVEEIDRWHKARGFRCIGYHYVVEIGAHCTGQNRNSIGIVYVGGLSEDGKRPMDTRTQDQKVALVRTIAELKRKYPGAMVHSHYEFAAKACPCFDAAEEYADL